MKQGKKYREVAGKVDKTKKYALDEAIKLLKEIAFAKFDESVDLAIRLNVDPRNAEQQVRGTIVLPHGTGKKVRVVVFVKGEKLREAQEAGADYVGAEELIEKIKGGWLEFDAAISTPDMMRDVGKLGKILGPRGLMPNPKSGTVTFELANAIKEIKGGKVEYRVDRTGIIHCSIGKLSFTPEQLRENADTLLDAVYRARPPSVKGQYVRSICLNSTMSPGIPIEYKAA